MGYFLLFVFGLVSGAFLTYLFVGITIKRKNEAYRRLWEYRQKLLDEIQELKTTNNKRKK